MITYRGTQLQTEKVYFDLWTGYAEPASFRGEDVTIPGADGVVWMPKVSDIREIELRGHIRGVGATEAERAASWRVSTDAVISVLMDYTAAPGTLLLDAPYLGLASSFSIEAVAVDAIGGPILNCTSYQVWSVRLLAHSPDWIPES
jgi:hypothetical protein